MRNDIITLLFTLAITPFIFDNGPDPVSDGFRRVIDEDSLIGYADSTGKIVIKPQFAFAYPFEDGIAKVTLKGKMVEVPLSQGEYHRFESDFWFCIDKTGTKVKCKNR